MADLLAQLEAEYCPPLDPALLSAILSDFDLTDGAHLTEARSTLDPLKESALIEEAAGFDASGTGAQDGGVEDEAQAQSCPGTSDVLSQETDLTSLSNGVSSLGLVEDMTVPSSSAHDAIENIDEDTKVDLLLEIFPDKFSRSRALYMLRKCKGNWHRAMEELLTHVYLDEAQHSDDENKVSAKGIDAFSEDNLARRGRKSKGKKKNLQRLEERRSSSLPVSPIGSELPPTNRWETSEKDIDFLAARLDTPKATITSMYHANGSSLSRTIGAILKKSVQTDAPTEDPILAVNAHDLSVDFPSIAQDYIVALVRLTHPSTAAAHELAKALTAKPIAAGGIQIVPKYTSPNLSDGGDVWETVSKQDLPGQTPVSDIDAPNGAEQARSYAAARRAALEQAHAAHRKAKSDRLMGGAAAYYGQQSRDLAALSSQHRSRAADELAASQSNGYQVDLHGIDVLNGVRIAQEKVERWWSGLGEHRANGRRGASERQAGFTIIVGRGIHSEGGKGKLGPAVSKMLKSEGWKFEPAGASIMVKGKART